MEVLFLKLLNMSITASYLVFAVIALRLLLTKAPKAVRCVLWGLVAVRLICPFSFESSLSLIPSSETIPQDIIYSQSPAIQSGIPEWNNIVNPILSESLSPEPGASVNPVQVLLFVASDVWIIGIIGMVLYAVISYFRLHKKTREGVVYQKNIWLCDHIFTPFILGLFHPRIFLPSSLDVKDMEYVIAHEQAHLKRHDHLLKPLGFALLTVYWFQPVMWLAYIMFCRDIEFACDEKVIKEMGAESKKSYSNALINCSASYQFVSPCPLAFGEVNVKGRIKAVLNYKKPAFWVVFLAVAASIAAAVCFLSNPKNDNMDNAVIGRSFTLSDIHDMNIGAQMPGLLYADNEKVILCGTCGMIVFDLKTEKITNRITAQELVDKQVSIYDGKASSDGEKVYFAYENFSQDQFYYKYEYNINTGEFREITDFNSEIFFVDDMTVSFNESSFEQLREPEHLIGSTVVSGDEQYIYLRARTDWSMESLQIVIYDRNSKAKKIIDVFGAAAAWSDLFLPYT